MVDSRIRVVVFTSGPTLESGVQRFLARLEIHPEISLVDVYAQSTGLGLASVWRDLRRRRGLLAAPLFVQRTVRLGAGWLLHPVGKLRLRRILARLADRVHFVPDIHADEVLDALRGSAPDLGLIYGSPILRPALFQIPRSGTLGIHHGKVPEYRGKKTTFWAMYNGEQAAGVTIQRVGPRLDAGEVVRSGEVEIGRRPLSVVWRRLERLGLDLYIEAILDVKRGTAAYRAQAGTGGRLYRDPRPRDLMAFWGRYLLRLVGPTRH
jgi:folate-dependent phosphoribosylglycinamide formyltransferase PurN